MKITIIGQSGSGKTVLAKRISETLKIPNQQIDRMWFELRGHEVKDSDGRASIYEEIERRVIEFIYHQNWVSDGFYNRIQDILSEEADYIVLIQLPLWRRFLNHLSRVMKKENRHPELTVWDDIYYPIDMIRRTFELSPKIKEFKEKYPTKIITLKSHFDIDDFLGDLIKNHPAI